MKSQFFLHILHGAKGALVLLALFSVISARAQEVLGDSGYASEDYLQEAQENIRIGVNPFSGESLRLYELRRQAERLALEAQLRAPSSEEKDKAIGETIHQYVQEARAEIQQRQNGFLQIIEDLNARINDLESILVSGVSSPSGLQQPNINTVEDVDSSSLAPPPTENNTASLPGGYLGYLDLGSGPRLVYRDSNTDIIYKEEENIEIKENSAILEDGRTVIFPNARMILSPLPASAFPPSSL